MEAQIKKGILEMCVLFRISEGEAHGYDVMKYMKKFFPEVGESTFYAILRRLHADGNAEITARDTRKYYRVTEKGGEVLRESVARWKEICAAVAEIGIK